MQPYAGTHNIPEYSMVVASKESALSKSSRQFPRNKGSHKWQLETYVIQVAAAVHHGLLALGRLLRAVPQRVVDARLFVSVMLHGLICHRRAGWCSGGIRCLTCGWFIILLKQYVGLVHLLLPDAWESNEQYIAMLVYAVLSRIAGTVRNPALVVCLFFLFFFFSF